jgi:hypothetical protein
LDALPYHIAVEDGILTMTWESLPTPASIQNALLDVLGHPSYRRGDPVIVVDPGTEFSPTLEDIRRIAKSMAAQRDMFGRLALVVEKPVHFGIGRMLQAYCQIEGVHGLQIFRELEQARAWVRGDAQSLEQSSGMT